jgi:ABC-type Fe3+-siderophore transport system permease subunit
MKRLITAILAGFALAAAGTTILWSRTPDHAAASSTISIKELHRAAAVNKLPIEEFEDMSLVFSRAASKL